VTELVDSISKRSLKDIHTTSNVSTILALNSLSKSSQPQVETTFDIMKVLQELLRMFSAHFKVRPKNKDDPGMKKLKVMKVIF
jgi:hypothetical protein